MKIRFFHRSPVTNALADAGNVAFSDSTATYGIKRIDTGEIVVAAGTLLNKFDTGSYDYDFTPIPLQDYIYAISWNGNYSVNNLLTVTDQIGYITYGGLQDANNYFLSRLHSTVWHDSTDEDKILSLISATRAIDNLRFRYQKTNIDQSLEFPRNASYTIPEAIKQACYELAITLIDTDPNAEYRNLRVINRRYSSVGTTYDTRSTPLNILAGIPSIVAWNLLCPYLADLGGVKLHRVS